MESDPIDQACENWQRFEETQIEAVRKQAHKPRPTATNCWHCDEPTENGSRWCDATCRDAWEKTTKR